MIETYTQRLATALVERDVCQSEDRDNIAYGLSVGIEYVLNITTTILLGVMFGNVVGGLAFLLSYSFLRTYAGGYHCKTGFGCYLCSNAVVAGALGAVLCTPTRYIPATLALLLLVASTILILFAPMETPTKPLDDVERIHYRRKTLIHLVVLCGISTILFVLGEWKLVYLVGLGVGVSAGVVLVEKLRGVIYCRS